jgi:hypothetical protein
MRGLLKRIEGLGQHFDGSEVSEFLKSRKQQEGI